MDNTIEKNNYKKYNKTNVNEKQNTKNKNFSDNSFRKINNKSNNNQKKIDKTTSKERYFLQNYNPNPNAKIKIIPLGGLDEIGMNITVFEDEKDIIIVDCGLAFPSEDLLGIDLVIPDIKYLKNMLIKLEVWLLLMDMKII